MLRFEEATDEFGGDIVHLLGQAMDQAWRRVERNHVNDGATGAIVVLAEHILALARQGERDPKRLVEGALIRLSL
jgi:hypothetical protein